MADSLSTYRRKRRFDETPEPRGRIERRKGDSFVVQKHDATRLHYDFRLELDGVLLSWAVARGPSLNPSDKRLAIRTEDHPVEYGAFEGVIPSGYGAGAVILWDRGRWIPKEDPRKGLAKGALTFTLNGERLKGGFALVRMREPEKRSKREMWLLIKARDQYASESKNAVETWTRSVKSGRTIEEMARKKTVRPSRAAKPRAAKKKRKSTSVKGAGAKTKAKGRADPGLPRRAPSFVEPQLALLKEAPPEGEAWAHEIKFDGYRLIAVIRAARVRLFTRSRQDWTRRYPSAAAAIERLGLKEATLDGELVALDDKGHARFALVQQAGDNPKARLVYYAFDLLNDGGYDTRSLPLIERKARLARLIGKGSEEVRLSGHVLGRGAEVARRACKMKLEGVISKQADAPYISGRTPLWIKSKCIGQDEFVVGGYRLSDKQGRAFRSLLLGEFDKGKLVYRGRVGAGFNAKTFAALAPRLRRLKRRSNPFVSVPTEARRNVVWVAPRIVAQVSYLETTPDGYLRHPTYLGLREDKPAQAVKAGASSVANVQPMSADKSAKERRAPRNSANGRPVVCGIRLSSPEKLFWPDAGVTKLDLALYYKEFSPRLLPFVKDRPLSLVRCPEGYEGECFFQKHGKPSMPDEIETIAIVEKTGGKADYLLLRKTAGLVGAAQIGGLELHVWGSRADNLEKPERLVFDLDPDEGLSFEDVKTAAVEMRERLEELGLASFPLLTGGKGVHVIAPIQRTRSWSEIKAFASGLARAAAAAAPDRYIAQASKAKREGRIFIDWLRNERGATAIAPFSPRRRKGAPVATPVSWSELSKIEAASAFTMKTVGRRLSRLRSDPWEGYGELRQSLKAAALEAVS